MLCNSMIIAAGISIDVMNTYSYKNTQSFIHEHNSSFENEVHVANLSTNKCKNNCVTINL